MQTVPQAKGKPGSNARLLCIINKKKGTESMKYQDWLNEWMENYIMPSSKQRTYTHYGELVKLHIIPHLGEYEMSDLSPIVLQRFVTELLQSGNLNTGKGLSANSVNGIITVVQSSLKIAYTLGIVAEFSADKIKRPKSTEKKVECFSLAEQKKIEQYILKKSQDKLFGILLCLYTGLRIGELLALEWSDIDLAKAELTVNRTCHYGKDKNGKFARITNTPKTLASARTLPLPKQIVPMLREVKKNSRSIYVISSGVKPISIRSYQKTFAGVLQKSEIPHRGFHSLRHTFATRALECGMDVKTLSEILGHKSPTVTLNRYVHSLMEHKKEMMNKVGKLL